MAGNNPEEKARANIDRHLTQRPEEWISVPETLGRRLAELPLAHPPRAERLGHRQTEAITRHHLFGAEPPKIVEELNEALAA